VRPLLHPQLVNGRTGDPALYVETLFGGASLLCDIGDIAALPPRKVLRLDQVFVSHTHVDHFFGFDRLLRLLIGREKTVRLHGPRGFTARVHHKLCAYEWNLVAGYENDLVFDVTEVLSPQSARVARFRLKGEFAAEGAADLALAGGVVHEDTFFRVSAVPLEHRDTVSLGFAIEEAAHVNVWKNRLVEMGLPVGAWLRDLKRAVLEDRPAETPILVGAPVSRPIRLDALRDAVTVTAGQKIAYVTDVADTPANRAAIIDLARGADVLFIEAVFARADAGLARQRAHLTTTAAGEIARAAAARRVEPFHFSARYAGDEPRLLAEVMAAFSGSTGDPPAEAGIARN
jgi:ribonuclease Z